MDANLDAFYFEANYTRREIDALGVARKLTDLTSSTSWLVIATIEISEMLDKTSHLMRRLSLVVCPNYRFLMT